MDTRARILIVDDEPSIRLFLGDELAQAGYEVTTAASGEQALVVLQEGTIDLILLDLKMEGLSGLQVMAEVEQLPMPPVMIMLTAHASLDSAIEAMRRGGHDYLLKPCKTEDLLSSVEKGLARRREQVQQQELLHQIEVSARRLQAGSPPESPQALNQPRFLEVRGVLLDRHRVSVTRQGHPVELTPSEFKLLQCLMERADQVVSHRELMLALHGEEGDRWQVRQALNTHLWNLRKKLGAALDGHPYLVNVRGRGYRFPAE